MARKLEKRIKRLEKQLKELSEGDSIIGLSGIYGDVVLHSSLKPDKAAKVAKNLSRFLQKQRQDWNQEQSRLEVH